MNLLEHYIKEIHSVKDITNKFEEKCGYAPHDQFLEVDLTCDCYGVVERKICYFSKSKFEIVKKQGYFMA